VGPLLLLDQYPFSAFFYSFDLLLILFITYLLWPRGLLSGTRGHYPVVPFPLLISRQCWASPRFFFLEVIPSQDCESGA